MLTASVSRIKESAAQYYLYFEHSFRKWDYFCLKGLIFWDKKTMIILQRRVFQKMSLRVYA